MLNQKIQNPNPDELMIEVDLCYELDPYELKLDEMIEANRDYWPALQKAWQDGEPVKK